MVPTVTPSQPMDSTQSRVSRIFRCPSRVYSAFPMQLAFMR